MKALHTGLSEVHGGLVVSKIDVKSQTVTSVWVRFPQATNAVELF